MTNGYEQQIGIHVGQKFLAVLAKGLNVTFIKPWVREKRDSTN